MHKPNIHKQVALAMMKAGKPVNVGDHIEYVICEKEGAKAAAERAFHPDDVERSEGELKVRVGVLRLHMCEFSLRTHRSTPPTDRWARQPN